MRRFFSIKKYLKISLLCLFFIGLPGAHQAMAKSFVALQSNTYLTFSLLLAFYHLLFFAKGNTKRKHDKSHLGLVILSLAVSFTFTQPGELKALLAFQETVFNQNLGFAIGLLLPSLVLLAYIFFGTKAALSNPGVAFWLFIGGVVINVS